MKAETLGWKTITVLNRLRAVRHRLDKTGTFWAVFAGAAAHCYGSARELTDIDILVRGRDLRKTRAALEGLEGIDVVADLELETDFGTCRFFMDDEMIRRVKRRTLLGVKIPVIPVEDNILLKAILQRGPEKGKHDIEDIRDMANNMKIDVKYLERRAGKCRATERVRPLLNELGVM